ncbi:hypothetical protein AB6A40_006422 [Gnathostoma spinigerum]|uniref:Uncharacterized protein n=1 Tax=Gnathostoma spinigerum TaxID=75299 RepID=A0ABD6EIJ2_9BILA
MVEVIRNTYCCPSTLQGSSADFETKLFMDRSNLPSNHLFATNQAVQRNNTESQQKISSTVADSIAPLSTVASVLQSVAPQLERRQSSVDDDVRPGSKRTIKKEKGGSKSCFFFISVYLIAARYGV